MAEPSHPLTESLQNSLGACLARADGQAKRLQLYNDASALYFANDKKLEIGQSRKRWGSQWVDPGDATPS